MGECGECGVCCEDFTKVRKQVPCGWCDFLVCTACTQRFLLELPDGPSCMQCKHGWDHEFLESKFTKTFINGALKKHREEVLFEVEKGLLPDTQPYAEAAKVTMGYDKLRKAFNAELKQKKKERSDIPHFPGNIIPQPILEQRKDINIRIAVIKEELKYLSDLTILARIQMENIDAAGNGTAAPTEARAFIKPCPSNDCRGFLSTRWKCGLCEIKVCSKCHEIKDTTEGAPDHECDPTNVATVEALAKHSKACPKCGAMIQRIEGCSQMFHTPMSGGCGAIFDWNTLRLHTGGDGTVHNPHWYEWQRHINNGAVPRQLGDVPMICGGVPFNRVIVQRIHATMKGSNNKALMAGLVSVVHQAYNHNELVVLQGYTVNMVADNRDFRIKYLLNDITEKRFKQLIQQREKERVKKVHIGQIIRMYQAAIGDILTRIGNANSELEIIAAFNEICPLIEYTNEHLARAAKIYSCVKSYVSEKDYKIKTDPKA